VSERCVAVPFIWPHPCARLRGLLSLRIGDEPVRSPSGHGKGAPLRRAMSRYGAAPLLPFHYTHSTEPSTAFGLAGAFFARRPIADERGAVIASSPHTWRFPAQPMTLAGVPTVPRST